MSKNMRNVLCVLFASALASSSALSAVVVTAVETDGNVVFSGGGSLDLAGATALGGINRGAGINPAVGILSMGPFPVGGLPETEYDIVSGPSSFGDQGDFLFISTTSGTGDRFSVDSTQGSTGPVDGIIVPEGYVSGTSLNGTLTFESTTFADLGLVQGSYVWSLPNDTFTLNIVPVPAAIWLFLSGLGLLSWFRRRQIA
jgi:hypothetical protein